MSEEETIESVPLERVSPPGEQDNCVEVASGNNDYDVETQRVTGGHTLDQLLAMNDRLKKKYFGYKTRIYYPTSGEATIHPDLFPDDFREKYADEKLRLGKMDVLPHWIKKIGSGIRAAAGSALIKHSSNTDTRFGYLVKVDKFCDIEAALLALKGIDDADREVYEEAPSILEMAEEQIRSRLEKRNDWQKMRDAPVTYNGYISYIQENYDVLRTEIISEYNRLFDNQELVDLITTFIPSRESLHNSRRIRFEWSRTQEMPAMVMHGETSFANISDRIKEGGQLAHELTSIREREMRNWREQILDSVSDIQSGVRSQIADHINRLKRKLDSDPLTEEEISEARESGKKRVFDPSRVTESSVASLIKSVDELTSELGEFNDSDDFYRAVNSLKEELGMESTNFDDEATRRRISDDIGNIVELSLEDVNVDPQTGQFFAGLI